MRGEDHFRQGERYVLSETPPRAWGRLRILVNNAAVDGNTPTCVGKTKVYLCLTLGEMKHPHVRGEDGLRPNQHRNTPTCVGKTPRYVCVAVLREKHPHVRGEDYGAGTEHNRISETPPRAWGRLRRKSTDTTETRNTPTCVGKTRPVFFRG